MTAADLDRVRAVAAHQRAELLVRSHALADDPRAVSGLSWGVAALDRVLRACDGVGDADELGPHPASPAEQDGLFGAGGLS